MDKIAEIIKNITEENQEQVDWTRHVECVVLLQRK